MRVQLSLRHWLVQDMSTYAQHKCYYQTVQYTHEKAVTFVAVNAAGTQTPWTYLHWKRIIIVLLRQAAIYYTDTDKGMCSLGFAENWRTACCLKGRIARSRMTWAGYWLPTKVKAVKQPGPRERGRPQLRQEDCVKSDRCREKTVDRETWIE